MPSVQEIYKTYSERKAQIDEKISIKKQEIESLLADVEALPNELAGQSEEYINRQKEKLMKKIERKTKKMQDWIDEQMQKVEDWLNDQLEKVQKKIDEVISIEQQVIEETGKLQGKVAIAVMTGQQIEEGETPEQEEQEEKTTPSPKPKFEDDEYRYCYKDNKGEIIVGLGSEVAKRKRYNQYDIYEDPIENLHKSNIFRQKYKWGFNWTHTIEELKYIDGEYKLVPTKDEKGFSSSDNPLDSIDEVFQFIDSKWIQYKGDVKSSFKKSVDRTLYKKTEASRQNSQSYKEVWSLEIRRFV